MDSGLVCCLCNHEAKTELKLDFHIDQMHSDIFTASPSDEVKTESFETPDPDLKPQVASPTTVHAAGASNGMLDHPDNSLIQAASNTTQNLAREIIKKEANLPPVKVAKTAHRKRLSLQGESAGVQPKKRGRRSRPATSQPATVEEHVEEPAEEAEAEVQPKRRARVKSRLSSSSPATAEQAEAEGVEEQPRKRARRSGPSTSKPAVTAAGAVAAPDAAAEEEPVAPDAAAEEEAVAPDAEAVEVDGGEVDGSAAGEEDFSQQVDWDAVRKLKTFAGRYLPKTRDGAGTWVTRRTLFFTLVPLEYQTTRLQLSFWKYLSEKTGAGVSEADAACQFVQEGTAAGAASAAD